MMASKNPLVQLRLEIPRKLHNLARAKAIVEECSIEKMYAIAMAHYLGVNDDDEFLDNWP